MQKTQHYELKKPEITDPLRVADFNENSDLIDAALAASAKALSDYKTANDAAVAKKAEQSTVAALEQSTNTTLTALQQNINTEFAAVAANLGSAEKNARIAWGSYTGTGTYGSKNPTSLTFDFYPVVIFIACPTYASSGTPSVFVRDSTKAFPNSNAEEGVSVTLTWSDNGVSWYSTSGAEDQNNRAVDYYYAAIGYDAAALQE